MLFIIPIQSIPESHKRWTFNSWRLQGHRQPTSTPITEIFSSTISTDINSQDQFFNIDNDEDPYNILSRLLKFFQILDREQKDIGNNSF